MRHNDTETATTVLPPRPVSARAARQFVNRVLMDWSCGRDVAQTAELLTSELVSNAVLHAQGSFELSVCGEEGEAIRIEVVDESPLRPVLAPPDGDVIAGRGLWLVDALAEEWGVEPSGHGKAVWFRLAR